MIHILMQIFLNISVEYIASQSIIDLFIQDINFNSIFSCDFFTFKCCQLDLSVFQEIFQ